MLSFFVFINRVYSASTIGVCLRCHAVFAKRYQGIHAKTVQFAQGSEL